MKRAALVCLALVAVAAAALARPGAASPLSEPAGWAFVLENNAFHGRYPDLPVGYVNSTRILTALMRRGWPSDHILLRRDVLEDKDVAAGITWLAQHARPGDVALFYVAGEYQFFARDLRWNSIIRPLWRSVPTANRVLVVETCFAERLTTAVAAVPGVALAAVGRGEWDWWGLRASGELIRGAPFTYFFARALENQTVARADFRAAFWDAAADARVYFRRVIAQTPSALASFHARGSFPENLASFPNPQLTVGPEEQEAQIPAAP